jgi:hypothetical protein
MAQRWDSDTFPFDPSRFKEPSPNIEKLRAMARAGREETERIAIANEGMKKVVWGSPDVVAEENQLLQQTDPADVDLRLAGYILEADHILENGRLINNCTAVSPETTADVLTSVLESPSIVPETQYDANENLNGPSTLLGYLKGLQSLSVAEPSPSVGASGDAVVTEDRLARARRLPSSTASSVVPQHPQNAQTISLSSVVARDDLSTTDRADDAITPPGEAKESPLPTEHQNPFSNIAFKETFHDMPLLTEHASSPSRPLAVDSHKTTSLLEKISGDKVSEGHTSVDGSNPSRCDT